MQKEDIWKPYNQQNKGALLYESQAIIDSVPSSSKVQIHEYMIFANKQCIEFNFDLKFSVKESEVKFEMNRNCTSLKLINKDDKEWRDVLKGYLNQKGFHEAFKPIKKIGKGNFASVYLAEKIEDKQKYAVKAFSKQAAYSQQNGKQCLIRQIQIMRHLNHPNLMKLKQVFQSDNSLYIIFQLLEGGQLHDKLKERKVFHSRQIRGMISGLLEGLKAMHTLNIMHRDLKPENILIRQKGGLELVIADFGLSQFSDADQYLFVRCGTPGFVAPQVINIKDMKKKYSPICDIFSLGLIFHIFLFGHSPFRKKTYNQVLAENRACKFDFTNQVYSNIPSETLDLLQKMLRVNPQQRITAEQALDHPYFKLEEESMTVNSPTLMSKMSMETDSSSMTSPKGKPKQLEKDSCLEFKMGKENIMKGKTDTVGNMGPTKVSMMSQSVVPARISKVSKFARAP